MTKLLGRLRHTLITPTLNILFKENSRKITFPDVIARGLGIDRADIAVAMLERRVWGEVVLSKKKEDDGDEIFCRSEGAQPWFEVNRKQTDKKFL